MTVLIIDDHPIVLQGCRRMLEDAGVTDVIEASDAVSGYQLFSGNRPEVVIIDLGLQNSRLGGLELIRRIRADDMNVRILVFSMHSDPVIVARALQAGATGYVVKDTSAEHFIEAFKKVRAGTRHLTDDLALQVAFVNTPAEQNPLADLTPRELQTLSLLAEGKSYNRIADELKISYKTVVNLSSQLKQKLNADNLPDLIRIAVQILSQQLPAKRRPL
jgi:two-component system, NarL family, invasion response regulator UvrY